MNKYTFVIDTAQDNADSRDLCAWVTGQTGQCGVGEEYARLAKAQMPQEVRDWFDSNIREEADCNGCFRPVKKVALKGWFNDGMGNAWKEGSTPSLVKDKYSETMENYYQPLINRAMTPKSKSSLEEELLRAKKKGPGTHPLYTSIGILLSAKPTPEILSWLKERCASFNQRPLRREWDVDLEISGFRLLEAVTTETESVLE